MTISVDTSERWRKLHHRSVRIAVAAWAGLVGTVLLFPHRDTAAARGIALGSAAFLLHFWLGLRIWHEPRRTGIGIPIALMGIRFIASLILFSVIVWQFPEDRRIVAWSGGIMVIVSCSIEAFVFAKGVGRL